MSTPNATPTEQAIPATPATPATPQAFDYATWKAAEDAKAAGTGAQTQAAATPKPGQPAADPKTATAPVDPAIPAAPVDPEDEGDDYAGLPKGVKRQLRQARRERDQAIGQVRAYEAMIAAGLTPRQAQAEVEAQAAGTAPAGEEEPDRALFANDQLYLKALAKYEAKKLFADELARQAGVAAERVEAEEFDTTINTANTKFAEDVKGYPNWAELADKMDKFPFNRAEQQTLVGLIGQSLNRAAVLVHWVDNPDQLKTIMAMSPVRQQAEFYRLEGRLTGQAVAKVTPATPAAPATPKPTPASRDAKKAAPSESVKVNEGTPTSGTPSMLLQDGSINPAWKALENEREGLRR